MRLFSSILLLSVAPLCLADDQDDSPKDAPILKLWQAELSENCKVTLNVSKIVSVSMHPYLLNGENLVTEVTVDTEGNNTIRFYYVHPDEDLPDITNPEAVVKSAKRKLSQRPSQPKAQDTIASVKFPEGAYAHTIEYQISSYKIIEDLYKSLVSIWEKSSKRRTTYKAPVKD